MRKFIRRPEGFTLIELMIVILIIAILVAIAVPVYLSAKKNAERRTCQANIRTVDGAIQTYESMDDGNFPVLVTDLTAVGTKVLKTMPTCPTGNSTSHAYAWRGALTPPEISCPYVADHTI